MNKLKFIQATQADKDYLLQLRLLTMKPHIDAAGLNHEHDEHVFRVMHEYQLAHLVFAGEDKVGVLKFQVDENEIKIFQIQIHPDFQRQGLGGRVIKQLFTTYPNHDFLLSVLKDNPAKDLYQRLGFEYFDQDQDEFFMRRVKITPSQPAL